MPFCSLEGKPRVVRALQAWSFYLGRQSSVIALVTSLKPLDQASAASTFSAKRTHLYASASLGWLFCHLQPWESWRSEAKVRRPPIYDRVEKMSVPVPGTVHEIRSSWVLIIIWITRKLSKNTCEEFPWWSSGYESAFQCRGHRFGPWSWKISNAVEQQSPRATATEPRTELLEPPCPRALTWQQEKLPQWEAHALKLE